VKRPDDQYLRRICNLLLVIAIVCSGILHWGTGRWEVEIQPDSDSYLAFDWSSSDTIFRGIRTPGYPLFLRAIVGFFGTEWIPAAHWLVLVGAVIVWRHGLLAQDFHPFSALCASVPMLFSPATWELGASIASDSLGIACCIATLGWFLAALGPRSSMASWGLVGATTLASILVRPAYLFLLPLLPVLACWLTLVVWKLPRKMVLRNVAAASLAVCVPFLGYCGVRAAAVGEFGLVSFAGYNLVGITGQWISDEDVPKLDGASQELARQMILRRTDVEDYAPPDDYETMARLYNATVWGTAAPAAEAIYGEDAEASNAALRNLALQSLSMHPWNYIDWLIQNTKHLLDQLLRQALSSWGARFALLGLACFLVLQAITPSAWMWPRTVNLWLPSLSNNNWTREWSVIWWVTISLICAQGLLVVLVEPALGRYVAAVGCTVPSLVGWTASLLIGVSSNDVSRNEVSSGAGSS
jgi:hypothetical protein